MSLGEKTWDMLCINKENRNHAVTLTPATACIEAVSNIISVEAFEGNELVLLDKDNLVDSWNKTTRSKYTNFTSLNYAYTILIGS